MFHTALFSSSSSVVVASLHPLVVPLQINQMLTVKNFKAQEIHSNSN
jgi:hypothetical protein